MNNIRTIKGGVNLKGKVKVPGDKSISHRALIIGSIAKGDTTIEGFLHSEDPLSTADCLRKLGVNIPEIKKNEPFTISGLGLRWIKRAKRNSQLWKFRNHYEVINGFISRTRR